MAEGGDGFLSRWSRRKQAVREGQPVQPEPPKAAEAPVVVAPPPAPVADHVEPAPAAPAPPTLEDVQALTADSDFRRFIAPDVAPEVKNAAMRKLFADPHFNVMDGLDVYIDDYGKPDPIPESMLRKMVSAKFLKLFDDEEKKEAADGAAPAAEPSATAPGAPSDPAAVPPAPTPGPPEEGPGTAH